MARRKTKQADVPRELEVAGELCLAFANTVVGGTDKRYRASELPEAMTRPAFTAFGDLLVWEQRMGVLGAADAERLSQLADEQPEDAAAVYTRALQLRDGCVRIFTAFARRQVPPAEDLDALNEELIEIVPRRRVVASGGGYRWAWADEKETLERTLLPIACSAAEMLVSGDVRKVHQCIGEGCTKLFVDRRSGRRKFCDRRTCGSRSRGSRFYKRWRRVR